MSGPKDPSKMTSQTLYIHENFKKENKVKKQKNGGVDLNKRILDTAWQPSIEEYGLQQ